MAHYDALIAKWGTLAPGTTAAKLTAVNALTVPAPAVPVIVQSWELYETMDAGEFEALSATIKARIDRLLGMGTVNLSTGTKARARLALDFAGAAGTITRPALSALAAPYEIRTQPWWSAPVAAGGGGLASPVAANDLAAAGGLT